MSQFQTFRTETKLEGFVWIHWSIKVPISHRQITIRCWVLASRSFSSRSFRIFQQIPYFRKFNFCDVFTLREVCGTCHRPKFICYMNMHQCLLVSCWHSVLTLGPSSSSHIKLTLGYRKFWFEFNYHSQLSPCEHLAITDTPIVRTAA